MSIAGQLAEAIRGDWGPPVGDPSKSGVIYRGRFGGQPAVLERRKKNFFLIWRGKEYDLGKRATFDHAERIIFREEREDLEEAKSADFYDSLYKRNKGIFWRGEGKGGKTTGIGAIGAGVYVTWKEGMAQAFANLHGGGEVTACKLKRGLKMMDSKGEQMAKIKRSMGFEPWEYSGDRMFANEITRAAKKLGYDGVASDNIAEGIVVFDPKNVTKVKA